jgi:hypothetical protein
MTSVIEFFSRIAIHIAGPPSFNRHAVHYKNLDHHTLVLSDRHIHVPQIWYERFPLRQFVLLCFFQVYVNSQKFAWCVAYNYIHFDRYNLLEPPVNPVLKDTDPHLATIQTALSLK